MLVDFQMNKENLFVLFFFFFFCSVLLFCSSPHLTFCNFECFAEWCTTHFWCLSNVQVQKNIFEVPFFLIIGALLNWCYFWLKSQCFLKDIFYLEKVWSHDGIFIQQSYPGIFSIHTKQNLWKKTFSRKQRFFIVKEIINQIV